MYMVNVATPMRSVTTVMPLVEASPDRTPNSVGSLELRPSCCARGPPRRRVLSKHDGPTGNGCRGATSRNHLAGKLAASHMIAIPVASCKEQACDE